MGEMKRLWAAVSILAALLAAALGTGWWVDGLTADYVSRLEQAQAMSERGDWERAAQVTGGVYRNWQERSFWLHALLRHSDTDQVLLLFRSVEEYLKLEEMEMCIRDRGHGFQLGKGRGAGHDLAVPVSYTRLDVYKRQTHNGKGPGGQTTASQPADSRTRQRRGIHPPGGPDV